MKKAILSTLILLIQISIFAQDPEFSYDYQHNKALLNPAYSGKIDYETLNIVANRLWTYPQAPMRSSLWFSMHFKHATLGIQMSASKMAQFTKLMPTLNYSYDITISQTTKTHLSFGLNGAFMQDYIDLNDIQMLLNDPVTLNQNIFSRYYPQIAVGTMIYNEYFEFGIAGSRLLPYSGYFFLNHANSLPPVLIVHGSYFYEHPLEIYRFCTSAATFVSTDEIYTRTDFTYYFRDRNLKLDAGLSGKYVTYDKSFDINFHFLIGLKLWDSFYLNYEMSFNSINQPIPFFAKLGNAVSLHFDFYKYSAQQPLYY